MDVKTFFELIKIISIDYPIALILGIIAFFISRKFIIKNYIVDLVIAFIFFIIFAFIPYSIVDRGYYLNFILYINKGITNIFNQLASRILLHKS